MQCIFEGIAICQNPVGSIDGIREMVCEHKWSNPALLLLHPQSSVLFFYLTSSSSFPIPGDTNGNFGEENRVVLFREIVVCFAENVKLCRSVCSN